jgi:hypothetical protein
MIDFSGLAAYDSTGSFSGSGHCKFFELQDLAHFLPVTFHNKVGFTVLRLHYKMERVRPDAAAPA